MGLEFRETVLPTYVPPILIGGPTNSRWGTVDTPGPAVSWVNSIQGAISRENLNAMMLVADETSQTGLDGLSPQLLNELGQLPHLAPFYVLTPQTQAKVEEMVLERTDVEPEIAREIVNSAGYWQQRDKIDALVGALADEYHPINLLSIDDDIVVPQLARQLKEEKFPQGKFQLRNSQVLFQFRGSDDDLDYFDLEPNQLAPMFENLGKTIEEIRRSDKGYRAVPHLQDTMQTALEDAQQREIAQFQVTYADGESDIPDADKARIVGAQAIKSRKPDITAANAAKSFLRGEFPPEEFVIYAFPSGPHRKFAFGSATSNIDSGTLVRHIDRQTAYWPWWISSSRKISKDNPTHIVTGHLRNDNDALTVLLKRIYKLTNAEIKALYEGGLPTQFIHNRAQSGYREGTIYQASSSAFGKIQAAEATSLEHLTLENGLVTLRPIDEGYEAPKEAVQKVYDLMYGLAMICVGKIQELEIRKISSNDPTTINDKIREYGKIFSEIYNKLAQFDPALFYKYANIEVRDQLRFHKKVVDAMPKVIGALREIIREEKYPVVEIYKSQ